MLIEKDMDTRLWLMGGGWLLVIAGCLLVPCICSAQMLVRSSLPAAASPDNTELTGVAPLTAPGGEAGVDDPLPADSSAANPTEMSNDDRLIRDYVEKAGPVGPRKWFSETKLSAYVRSGVTYDDNILLSTTAPKQNDVIVSLVGGARLSLGDFTDRVHTFAVVGYTGTGELFTRHGAEDSYDQDAIVDLYYRQHQIGVGSTSTFQERHDETADLGERVGRRVYGEDFNLKYYRNDYTTISSETHYEYDDYDTSISTSNLTLGIALDYTVASKVTLGVGGVFGRLAATGGVEEYSEQGQFRLGYAVTHKVLVTSSVGVEYRERGSGAGDSVTPVFAITGKWTPFTGTTLTLEGHRQTQASGATNGEDFLDTGVQVGVRQDLLQRIYVRLDLGYQNADYNNVTEQQSIPRNDNYLSLRGTAGYYFVEWLQVLAFYERRQDDSTRSNFSFTSNRVGLEVSLIY